MTEVHIQINREPFTWRTPTKGEELYRLGEVGEDHELFRETPGEGKDPLIRRDSTEIHIKDGEHFYSEKIVTIVVEGTPHRWPEDQLIPFDQVVKFEVPNYPNGITYAVKYWKGPPRNPEGVLAPGGKVKVKEGMTFNVSETGQS